jgi:hypothetical protein
MKRSASSCFLCSLVLNLIVSVVVAQQIDWRITQPRYAVPTPDKTEITSSEIDSAVASATTIPMWTSVATDPLTGVKYQGRFVGKSIFLVGSSEAVDINAPIVALDLLLAGHVFDPHVSDPVCLPSTTAVNLTRASPIYQKHSYSFGGKSVGFTQYVDAFQRANFYHYTNPAGTSPGYHVYLNPTGTVYFYNPPIKPPATASGVAFVGKCGIVGLVSMSWLQNFIRTHLIPGLNTVGVGATQFPVFLFYNVVMCPGNPANGHCGILGFHDGYKTPSGVFQTYGVAEFDTTGLGALDIEPLSHEVGEWMNDPLVGSISTVNLVPHYGNVGQVSGCQINLEVGDVLSGHHTAVTQANGITYHPQEMAFISWFYHFSPSLGINGWYSNLGRLRGYAKPCPPGGTF